MATIIQSSDLDFDTIKENLKTYLKSKSEFADYNFEASGLSNILDVLAYNTHLNGLIANIGVNESFLGSAQLRSSVVSHAEGLGYYPRSVAASTATIKASLATGVTSVNTVTLPANSTFSASVDGVSYTFQTLEAYIATNDGSGNFAFKTSSGDDNLPIKEGTLKTKTFIVGETTDEQVYIIPDKTVDTNTLSVKVFDTFTSSTFAAYTDIENQIRINTDSTVYFVREAPNGFYELIFSDGNVLGKAPQSGNKIEVTYLSTKGAVANGATTFIADDDITINSVDYTVNVTTSTNSAAGAAKESISSVKANAPLAFATQQRLVTSEDYKALILQRYSASVEDVVSWGGNDNVPAIYGRVYVALKFKSGVDSATQASVKASIKEQLSESLAIMSIDTVFSDPVDTFIELTTKFNFDPDLTGDTVETTQANVSTTINNFFANNLSKFESVFRRSVILGAVDDISPAVLNTTMSVKVQQRLVPTLNNLQDFTTDFPVVIADPSAIEHTISTSSFTALNQRCFIRNRLGSTSLELVGTVSGDILRDNIGSYNPQKGTVTFNGIEFTAFEGTAIKISSIPANQATVRPLRNYILNIDTERSAAIAELDFQNTAVTL